MSAEGFVEQYAVLNRLKPPSLRTRLRGQALNLLSLPLLNTEEWLNRPRIQFLYIHHVFKDELAALERLIRFLQKQHQFISYTEAWEKIRTGSIDRPYIVFSSDDGLKNNLDAAAIFERYGISACFFLNPNTVGLTNPNAIAAFCKDKLHFPPVEFLNWKEVDRLLKAGHEIGSHTMDHINVAASSPELAAADIRQSYEVLQQHCGEIKHFAYPYGRFFHFSPAGREIVFDSGFQSCASAERGCHINPPAPLEIRELLIRRDHVILHWPLNHIRYFLIRNARNLRYEQNLFPY